jgi:ribosome biogenesis GTPase
MTDERLAALGWDGTLSDAVPDGHSPARVLVAHGALVGLAEADGERLAPMRGALRDGVSPVVGDWVAVDDAGAVAAVLPRRGSLRRAGEDGAVEVLAAHVDVVLIATSLNRDLNRRRLERFLALAGEGEVRAVVLLTKADLDPEPFAVSARVARAVGAPAVPISVHDGWGMDEVWALLEPGRTAALLGTSGVGKSTLVNALLGEDRQQILPIRERDDRGRHATTRRELFVLPNGALLIDTPGLRLQRLASGAGVADAFADVEALAAACRFGDCTHTSEPGCAVLAAIEAGELAPERLEAMRRLELEARWAEERQGGPGEAARRARGRTGSLAYRRSVEGRPKG